MVQELNVLRCYSCKIFQVHIVKKAKKWQCKICNEKQSIQNVYYQGSGQECRLHVQNLNYVENFKKQEAPEVLERRLNIIREEHELEKPPAVTHSKWTKFITKPQKDSHEVESNDNEELYRSSVSKENTCDSSSILQDDSNRIFQFEKLLDEEIKSEDSSSDVEEINEVDYIPSLTEKSTHCNLFKENECNSITQTKNHYQNNYTKRKFNNEDIISQYEPNSENEIDLNSPFSKRTKIIDKISFEKQSLHDIIKLNRSNIKKCSNSTNQNGITNRESVSKEKNNSFTENKQELSESNIKKKVFETECDDLDDSFEF